MKFYQCTECNQISYVLNDQNKPVSCCSNQMIELIPNMEEGIEEHKPNVRKVGNFVTITVNHPMLDVHHIDFIFLETNQGFSYKDLKDQVEAKADFILSKEEEIKNVYVLCNIHSLFSLN